MSSEAFSLFLLYLCADLHAVKSEANMTDGVDVGASWRYSNGLLVEMEADPCLASTLLLTLFSFHSHCVFRALALQEETNYSDIGPMLKM